jgi:hypothetical protein
VYWLFAGLPVALAIAALLVGRIEAVPGIARKSGIWLAYLLQLPLGRDSYQTPESDSGIAIIVAILAAAVTQLGALFLNDKGHEYLHWGSSGLWFYEAGNLLLLGMVSGVLRATKLNRHGIAVGKYDMGTRIFAYFSIAWIIVGGMVVVPVVGHMGEFPTHEKKVDLPVREARPYVFQLKGYAGLEGLEHVEEVQPGDFGGSIPETLRIKLVETAEFNRMWRVANLVKTEVLSGDGNWKPASAEQVPAMIEDDEYASGASREVTFIASHLLPTQSTRMTFRIFPRKPKEVTAAARAVALNALKTEHPITVTAIVPPGPAKK